MEFDLESHTPSDSARRRAQAAGLDIDALKRDEPLSYMMLCSQPVLHLAPELEALATAPLEAAFGDQQLFEAETGERQLVLAFPGPQPQQLQRFDELMGEMVEQATADFAYYRVVQELSGTRRELDLPTAPGAWQGASTMVGPFGDEGAAREWGQAQVVPRAGMTYDVLNYAGGWFCDVFDAADLDS